MSDMTEERLRKIEEALDNYPPLRLAVPTIQDTRDLCTALREARRERDELRAIVFSCPGCIKCGPPIFVKAEDGCDGSGVRKHD